MKVINSIAKLAIYTLAVIGFVKLWDDLDEIIAREIALRKEAEELDK